MNNQDRPSASRRAVLLGGVVAAGAMIAKTGAQAQEAARAPAAAPPRKPEWVPGRAMAAVVQEFPPITQAEKDAALLRPKDPPPLNPPAPKPPPTDAAGLTAGDVMVPTFDRQMYAYRAYPAGKRGASVVVLMPSNGGVTEAVKDIVRRVAKAGYYCIAGDFITPYPQLGEHTPNFALIFQTNEALTQLDFDAQVAFAAKEGANAAKLACMGFSWGARQVWKVTARNPKILAGASFYGPLSAPGYSYDLPRFNAKIRETHPSPIEMAAGVKGRVIGFYGTDPRIPEKEELQPMRDALRAAGDTKTQIVVFPDVAHGFFEPSGAAYVPARAQQAWDMMLAWFKSHGVT
ncbi:MAG: carboxymethylenebutenolidase [Caulobacteraceae bacterium]|nr:carboxymethylenebutenolidase [Caulobacteraceae bacterium]